MVGLVPDQHDLRLGAAWLPDRLRPFRRLGIAANATQPIQRGRAPPQASRPVASLVGSLHGSLASESPRGKTVSSALCPEFDQAGGEVKRTAHLSNRTRAHPRFSGTCSSSTATLAGPRQPPGCATPGCNASIFRVPSIPATLRISRAVCHDILHFSARVLATIIALPSATPHRRGFLRAQ